MSNKLTPVYCEDETEVLDAAMDGVRRRPVVARNEEGELVVCCRRTAIKRGWEIEGKLFTRTRKPKAPKAQAKEPANEVPTEAKTAMEDLSTRLSDLFS